MQRVVSAAALILLAAAFLLEGAAYVALAVPQVGEAPALAAGRLLPDRAAGDGGAAACEPGPGRKC
jgi:hypothetical protein